MKPYCTDREDDTIILLCKEITLRSVTGRREDLKKYIRFKSLQRSKERVGARKPGIGGGGFDARIFSLSSILTYNSMISAKGNPRFVIVSMRSLTATKNCYIKSQKSQIKKTA
jgi:hypothetical protein